MKARYQGTLNLSENKTIVKDIFRMNAFEWIMCVTVESSSLFKEDLMVPLF